VPSFGFPNGNVAAEHDAIELATLPSLPDQTGLTFDDIFLVLTRLGQCKKAGAPSSLSYSPYGQLLAP
jgi:hypothetical protein